MLKILSGMPNRVFYISTKSPPEHFSISKIKIKEKREKSKRLNEYENAVVVFDDMLDTSNSKYIDQFFIRVRHSSDFFIYHKRLLIYQKEQHQTIVAKLLCLIKRLRK